MGAIANEYLNQEIDSTVAGTTYVGYASPGKGKNEAFWQIEKILDDGAGNVSKHYANGSSDFIFVWDDRDTYTY